nr:BBF_HP1_G0030690.mRNA.1.CDS.1 [Saccharomyces cerevisiae]
MLEIAESPSLKQKSKVKDSAKTKTHDVGDEGGNESTKPKQQDKKENLKKDEVKNGDKDKVIV